MSKKKRSARVVATPPARVDAVTGGSDFRVRVHEAILSQRQAVQARRGSYRAAQNPRTRVQTPYGGSGDQHADQWSRRMTRELARDMDRNADSFRIMADGFAASIVGDGVRYRPTTKDAAWNKEAARLLDDIMRKERGGIDARQIRSGYRILHDLVRTFAVDGEVGGIKLSNGLFQPVESDQVVESMVGGNIRVGDQGTFSADGIRLAEGTGAPLSFKVVPYDLAGAPDFGHASEIPAQQMLWLAHRNRFSQTRGMPLLVACLEDWERIDSYRESEIIGAEQGSQIYGVIEHPEGDLGTGSPFTPQDARTDPSQIVRSGLDDEQRVDWQPTVAGALLDLPDGKKYVPVNPSRPNRDAAPFLIEMLRQFCANTGLPYEIHYNDLRGLSWSVNRALVQLARDRMRVWQVQVFGTAFASLFHWQLMLLMQSKKLPFNAEWERHELAWPQISWPDEGAEYDAQANGLLRGLTTRHRVHGPHWRDLLEERAEELAFASELAKAHNTKYPDFEVTPAFFLGFQEAQKSQKIEKTDLNADGEQIQPGVPAGKQGAKPPAKKDEK